MVTDHAVFSYDTFMDMQDTHKYINESTGLF